MEAVEKELSTAAKRQRASIKKTLDSIDALLSQLQSPAATGTASAPQPVPSLLALKDDHKLLHAALSKLGKAIDKLADGADSSRLSSFALQGKCSGRRNAGTRDVPSLRLLAQVSDDPSPFPARRPSDALWNILINR